MASMKRRTKKLNVKTLLPVLRESQVDPSEFEDPNNESQIQTGVEQGEENEYHLQAVLKTTGVSEDKEIPVPPPQPSKANYDALYPSKFDQPSTYLRFSQTVEDCIGCRYDMTVDDEQFLKSYNQKRPPTAQCSEDDFEMIMDVFEETASIHAPFASVDNTVVSYEVMVQSLTQDASQSVLAHAKDTYEFWKERRQLSGNRPLQPSLKYETHQETDDMDPYVCFRRREIRQTRKTRARDVQSADKLKRLRRELEEGRLLVQLSSQREVLKRELLLTDRLVFEQRCKVKDAKVRLGITADDDDLLNRPKKKASDITTAPHRPPSNQLRMPFRPDGRLLESDLVLLVDKQAEKENELRVEVERQTKAHRTWNKNHIDLTREPLSPVEADDEQFSFRSAVVEYLLTPPGSVSEEDGDATSVRARDARQDFLPFVFHGSPSTPTKTTSQPTFRRRIGRLNRLWIDRRGVSRRSEVMDHTTSDQWKYDQDDGDEQPVYEVDPFDARALDYRTKLQLMGHHLSRRVPSGDMSHGAHPHPSGNRTVLAIQQAQT